MTCLYGCFADLCTGKVTRNISRQNCSLSDAVREKLSAFTVIKNYFLLKISIQTEVICTTYENKESDCRTCNLYDRLKFSQLVL